MPWNMLLQRLWSYDLMALYKSVYYYYYRVWQTTPSHIIGQLDKCIREASTLDGVLEFRHEHFWTVAFGMMVCIPSCNLLVSKIITFLDLFSALMPLWRLLLWYSDIGDRKGICCQKTLSDSPHSFRLNCTLFIICTPLFSISRLIYENMCIVSRLVLCTCESVVMPMNRWYWHTCIIGLQISYLSWPSRFSRTIGRDLLHSRYLVIRPCCQRPANPDQISQQPRCLVFQILAHCLSWLELNLPTLHYTGLPVL